MAEPVRVVVMPLGGTIDSLGASPLDHAWYTEFGRRISSGALLAQLPPLDHVAVVEAPPSRRTPSYALTSADLLQIARSVQNLANDPRTGGIVITHGTNTLEETAYFLDLVLDCRVPVVLTGAMRPARSVGWDGPINLLRAVQVATHANSAGHGVLIVFNDTIHRARDGSKTETFRVDAFGSRDTGPVGVVRADGAVQLPPPRPRNTRIIELDSLGDSVPRVDIVLSYVDADDTHIRASHRAGPRSTWCQATPRRSNHELVKEGRRGRTRSRVPARSARGQPELGE